MEEEDKKISNVSGNRQLYKKAYLLEFTDENGDVEAVFTFSIPPEGEELTYSQRKAETKTFGGLHVDEYGMDAVKITLSGSTVNQELKRIYRAGKGEDDWLTGEDEIYNLRDLIEEHKSIKSVQENKKVYLYDLSKFPEQRPKTRDPKEVLPKSHIKNYWRVFIGDFKIRRNSDRPFTYKYSIEFTALPPDKTESKFMYNIEFIRDIFSFGPRDDTVATDPFYGLSKIKLREDELPKVKLLDQIYNTIFGGLIGAIDFIDGINGKANDIFSDINKVSSLIKILGNVMTYSTSTLTGIIDSAGKTLSGFVDAGTSVVNGVNSVISLPMSIWTSTLNIGMELQNAANRLMKSVGDLGSVYREATSEPEGRYYQIPREVLTQYGMSNEEFKDTVSLKIAEVENISSELVSAAKSSDIPDVKIGNPDPVTGEQTIILSYGETDVAITAVDTLESLAAEYYGDPDKAIDIATFNGVASLNDLEPGRIIRIPVTKQTAQNKNNRIFSRKEDRDNYGRDIMFTENGNIVASETGDYALTSGVNNLSQAILFRLKERVNKRIRLTAYGIRTNISDPTAGTAYIVSSVDLTVNSDPRVSVVRNIRFRARGDALHVDVIYTDINRAQGNAVGGV